VLTNKNNYNRVLSFSWEMQHVGHEWLCACERRKKTSSVVTFLIGSIVQFYVGNGPVTMAQKCGASEDAARLGTFVYTERHKKRLITRR